MDNKNKSSFLAVNFILLVGLIGLILLIFDLNGTVLFAHLIFFVLLIILSFISISGIYYNMKWGWLIMTLLFAMILVDELFIYLLYKLFGTVFLISILSSIVGLIVSLVNIKYRPQTEKTQLESVESIEKVEKPSQKSDYIAGKTGKSYHLPDCRFAKNIDKSNQVWLSDKESANSKGYKPHSCVK
jgi:predicted membrane protein